MKRPDCANCEYIADQMTHDPEYPFVHCDTCKRMEKYNAHLESRWKFTVGDPIESVDELLKQEWVFMFGKPKHIAFVVSMPLRIVSQSIKGKRVFHAIRKPVAYD